MRLVPVLRPRGAETPEPRKPDRAARGAAGASGQVRSQPGVAYIRGRVQGGCEEERFCDLIRVDGLSYFTGIASFEE